MSRQIDRHFLYEISLTASAIAFTSKAVSVIFLPAASPSMKGCHGYYSQIKKGRHLIALSRSLNDVQVWNTYLHELAHCVLHSEALKASVTQAELRRYTPQALEAGARLRERQAEELASKLRALCKGSTVFEKACSLAKLSYIP